MTVLVVGCLVMGALRLVLALDRLRPAYGKRASADLVPAVAYAGLATCCQLLGVGTWARGFPDPDVRAGR